MIEFLSSWAKGLGLSIVAISILEMLLPNNKTKKYIRAVMGVYVLFTIVSPFIKNKDIFNVNNIDLENYTSIQTSSAINQSSRDEKIQELYIEEIEKDITKKVKEKGFEVTKCKVNAQITNNENETKITKIKLNIKKDENTNETKNTQSDNIENKIVTEVQKIKTIDATVQSNVQENTNNSQKSNVSKADIQNIKKFLIEEYEVSEQCLEIN